MKRSESRLKPLIDCRLDMESEKITKFFSFDCRTTSIARRRAYNSALKMLAASGNRTHLVTTRDYGITYLFHDRRARANMGLRTAQSMGHSWSHFSGVGYGTLSPSRHCVERQETKVGHEIRIKNTGQQISHTGVIFPLFGGKPPMGRFNPKAAW